MLLDPASIVRGTQLQTAVCIVGAGLSGIVIARRLAEAGIDVILIEGGGEEPTRAGSDLLKGRSIGAPAYLRRSRARAFGGTGHRWTEETGFRSRPLRALDFEVRPGIAHSGWPFGLDQLDPFYTRASALCAFGAAEFTTERWSDDSAPEFKIEPFQTLMFQFGPRDAFSRHLEELQNSKQVTLVLGANAIELVTTNRGARASTVHCATMDGNAFEVTADEFVLAGGAIENARLLLASRADPHPAGVGNQHDLVGRFFMDHPTAHSGQFRPADRLLFDRLDLYRERHDGDGVPVQGMLALSEERQRFEELLGVGFWLLPADEEEASAGILSARQLAAGRARRPWLPGLGRHLWNVAKDGVPVARYAVRRASRRPRRATRIQLRILAEQLPNPDSRVTLIDKRDRVGMPRVQLDWRVGDAERHSIRRTQQLLSESLQALGGGSLERILGDERPVSTLFGDSHHMGTTRMNNDPRQGVVDGDCRVHGVPNLYIGGSSVFPTGGFVNPVLTNAAMSLRLGDHLAAVRAGALA